MRGRDVRVRLVINTRALAVYAAWAWVRRPQRESECFKNFWHFSKIQLLFKMGALETFGKLQNFFKTFEKFQSLSQLNPAAAATRRDRGERARPHTTIQKLWCL